MDRISPVDPEFSRPVAVERLDQGELAEHIVAREEERAALAARFGLVALDRLEADVALRKVGAGPVVRVEGRLEGDVVQRCVVSLEPIANRVEESFVLTFAPGRQLRPLADTALKIPSVKASNLKTPASKPGARKQGGSSLDATGEDGDFEFDFAMSAEGGEEPPEPLIGGIIDIGEAVAQQLALGLDPYPRKPGIRLEDVIGEHPGVSVGSGAEPGETAVSRPFADLARFSRRKS